MERTEEPHIKSRKEHNELCENSLWMDRHLHHDDWRCGYRIGQRSLATEINVLLLALKAVLNDPKDDSANRWIIINMMSDLCASHSFEPEQRQIDRLCDIQKQLHRTYKSPIQTPVEASDAGFDASNTIQPCHNCRNESGIYARTWQDIEGFPEAYNYVDYFPEQNQTPGYIRKQISHSKSDVYYCENCEAVWSVKS